MTNEITNALTLNVNSHSINPNGFDGAPEANITVTLDRDGETIATLNCWMAWSDTDGWGDGGAGWEGVFGDDGLATIREACEDADVTDAYNALIEDALSDMRSELPEQS